MSNLDVLFWVLLMPGAIYLLELIGASTLMRDGSEPHIPPEQLLKEGAWPLGLACLAGLIRFVEWLA